MAYHCVAVTQNLFNVVVKEMLLNALLLFICTDKAKVTDRRWDTIFH